MGFTTRVRLAGRLIAEALCPLAIVAIALHATGMVVWREYEGRDVQIYATIARFWQDGFIPYRDLYDFKPPLIFIALRLGYYLWGHGAASLWRVVVILTAICSVTMYAGLRRAGNLLAAPLAALGMMTLVIADPWHVVSQNTELLAAIFAAAALGCAAAQPHSRRRWWAMGSGVGLALATLGKQPAILWAIPIAAQLWLWAPRQGWRPEWRELALRTLWCIIGFAGVVGVVVCYFAWHGAATALYQATVVDGGRYAGVGKEPWRVLLSRPTAELLRDVAGMERMWPFVAAVVALVPLSVVRPSRWALVLWLWLLTSYVVVVIGPRQEWHYLMAAFPALAIAVGIAFEMAVGVPPAGYARDVDRQLLGGLLMALIVYGSIWHTEYFLRRRTFMDVGVEAALGARIQQAARPGDTLFVKDEPYDLYLHCGMPPMTRFVYPDAPAPGAPQVFFGALERQPTFIFISYGTQGRLAAPGGYEAPLAKLLNDHYDRWLTDRLGLVYRRRDAGEIPAR